MASIDEYPPAKGSSRPRWKARWREPGGKARSRVFARKLDAERWLAEMDHSRFSGFYRDPDAGKVTVREAGEAWRDRQVHRDSTAAMMESHLRRHVYPFLGDRRMDSVSRSDVQAWVRGRSEVLAPATVHVVYGILASIYRDAVHDRVVVDSPCVKIALPKKDKGEVVPPSGDAVAALLGAVDDRYRLAVVLAAFAGLRLGEVFGLTLDRVDVVAGTVRVDRQLLTPATGPVVLAPPKTPSSTRTVPVAPSVVAAVEEHARLFPPAGTGEFRGLLVVSRTGAPVRRSAWQAVWAQARKDTGLDTRFHDLRHHYASLLISSGCSVKTVQAALGHKNASETLDIYSHLWPGDEDRARDAVEAAMGVSRKPVVS